MAIPAIILAQSPLAAYEINQGSGTQMTDGSGNANHGTLGATTAEPLWAVSGNEGLDFDGVNDRVNIPAITGTVSGIDIVFNCDDTINAALPVQGLLITDANSGISFGTQTGLLTNELITVHQVVADAYAAEYRVGYTHASNTITGWHCLQCDTRASSFFWTIKLDGTELSSASANIAAATPFITGQIWTVGMRSGGASPYDGKVAYLVLYPTSRDDATQESCRQAIGQAMAARGVTLPNITLAAGAVIASRRFQHMMIR